MEASSCPCPPNLPVRSPVWTRLTQLRETSASLQPFKAPKGGSFERTAVGFCNKISVTESMIWSGKVFGVFFINLSNKLNKLNLKYTIKYTQPNNTVFSTLECRCWFCVPEFVNVEMFCFICVRVGNRNTLASWLLLSVQQSYRAGKLWMMANNRCVYVNRVITGHATAAPCLHERKAASTGEQHTLCMEDH